MNTIATIAVMFRGDLAFEVAVPRGSTEADARRAVALELSGRGDPLRVDAVETGHDGYAYVVTIEHAAHEPR
jgi:hypothetical protein